MAINVRGAALLALTTAGFAASVALVWPRHAHAPTASRAGPGDAGQDAAGVAVGSKAHRALCLRLAEKYALLMEDAAIGCKQDDDCVAEERGGVYVALDGCARFRSKATPTGGPDSISAQWLAGACAWAPGTNVDCGGARAQCVAGRCVERPPDPLPRDWKRLSLPGTLSVFAPPDFTAEEAHGEDSQLRVYDGERRRLEMQLDPHSGPFDSVDPAYHARLDVVDGERAWVYLLDHGDAGDRRYEGGMLFVRHFSEFFLGGGYLTMRMYCTDARACADRAAIFGSARVLAEPVEVAPDR